MASHILPSSADLATQADNSLIASALKVLEQRQRYISHTFESPQGDCIKSGRNLW
jgi:hypothetical protein